MTSAESSNSVEEGSEKQEDREYFPATQLFEYHWPLGTDSPEHYMLQEQVAVYLDIRGIQRKYPGTCTCVSLVPRPPPRFYLAAVEKTAAR